MRSNEVTLKDRQSEKTVFWLGLVLVLLYLTLYLFPLGNRPLLIPDETRYAEIPREMLASGDWVTPRLNDLRYFEKPPLGYWVNAVSISLLGENPFAVRLSSALATGLTTLLIYLFVIKTFGSRHTALLAAFIHMTFLEVYIIGTFSVLDNLLALFLTAGIMAYFLAILERKEKIAWMYWSVSGVSLGLAFLTKGFLALAVPVLVLLPWLLWQDYFRSFLLHGFYVVLVAILVALPWGLLIHFQEGDFWHYFFWVEHIQRFAGENAQHKAPFYYFLVSLPVLAFPWLSLSFAALAGLRSTEKKADMTRLIWLWLLLPLLFFSISSGKLVTYILPCFPPLAILMGVGLTRYLKRANTRFFDIGILLNILVLAGLLIALVATQFFHIGSPVYQQEEVPRLVIMVASLVLSVVGGFLTLKNTHPDVRLALCLFLVLPFIIFTQFASPDLLRQSKNPGVFLTQSRDFINKDTLVVSDGSMLRAVNWYLKRNDVYLISAGEVAYGLEYEDAVDRRLEPSDKFAALIASREDRPIVVFCRKNCPEDIQSKFPENSQRHSYGLFSMWHIPAAFIHNNEAKN